MACSIKLTENQSYALEDTLRWSEFQGMLEEYYQGRGNAPDISLLYTFILEDVIPEYFDGRFVQQDLLDFLDDATNGGALQAAIVKMINSTISQNTTGVADVPYASPRFDIYNQLYAEALKKVDNKAKDEDEKQRVEENEVSSADGLLRPEAFFKRRYANREAYIQDRFKASSLTHNLFRAKFIHEHFIKAVYADTDTRKIVSQVQIPGQVSEIDTNLKAKRMDLLADLITRLNLKENVNGKAVPIEMNESLLSPSRFEDVLTMIEDAVLYPTYNKDTYDLTQDGVLFELSNKYQNSIDTKTTEDLGAIVNNYIDYVIVSDYDKILEYYFPDSISVNKRVNPFDKSIRKYNLSSPMSEDAMNIKWEEKVQDGIDNSAELYKMIIDTTPMLSFVTGLPMKETLYPPLVSEVFSRYFSQIDFQNPVLSIKQLIIQGLEVDTNSFTTKNVLYTLYKRFFEEDADVVTLSPNNIEADRKNRVVNSLLATARTDGDNTNHPLMLLITKPLEEVSKVFYAEALESRRGRPSIVYASTNSNTVTKALVMKKITNQLNRDSDTINEVVNSLSITNSHNSGIEGDIYFKYDGENHVLSSKKSKYTVDAVMALTEAVLGITLNSTTASADREFYEELKAISSSLDSLPHNFLQFVRTATKMLLAKQALQSPKIQKILKEERGAKSTGNKIIDQMIESKDSTLNYRDPELTTLTLSTPAAHEMYDLITLSNNRYSGNRIKSTVTTLEGTTVAGFSLYNYFLGYKNNLLKAKQMNNSVVARPENRNVLRTNAFFNDPNLLNNFYVRGAIKIGDQVKSNSSHNVLETLVYNINLGYFGIIDKALTEEKPVTAMFDPTTYSDKTTNFLPNVNNVYNSPGKGAINLFVDSNGVAVNEDVTLRLGYETSAGYYRAYANNIVDTWTAIYDQVKLETGITNDLIFNETTTLSEKLTALNDTNTALFNQDGHPFGLKGFAAARYYADKAGVHLTNWIHFQNNAKTLDPKKVSLTIKPALIKHVALFDKGNNITAYKSYIDDIMVRAANQLVDLGFELDGDAARAISKMYPRLSSQFVSGKADSPYYYVTSRTHQGPVTSPTQINPAIRKFFYDWNFISKNLLDSSLGSVYSHKGGDENAMFTTMSKRNVAAGASMRRFTLGLENGVEDFTRTALVDDITSELKSILGAVDTVVDLDGAALVTYTQRMKTWNSLNSKFASDGGLDQKPFGTHFDANTGEVAIDKDADFVMTNHLIRNSIGSDIDLLELHKNDLYNTDISKHDITLSWKDDVNLTDFSDVYRWDRKFDYVNKTIGNIYQLHSIKFAGPNLEGINQYQVTESNLTTNSGPQTRLVTIATMFDLWQVLGGIDSVQLSDDKTAIFYNEGNRKMYVKESHTASEKLLDFELYMGNKGESFLPEQYIVARNQEDLRRFTSYKNVFGTDGVVSSHIQLISDSIKGGLPTQDTLDFYHIPSNPIAFAAFIKDNKAWLKGFIPHILNDVTSPDNYFKWLNRKHQPFKGKNIERITTAGARKVGQFNMNDSSTFSKSRRAVSLANLGVEEGTRIPGVTSLITHKINTMNSGVQLSAYHETEGSKVTLPTQMFNAFAFKGNSLVYVNEIYNAIADIVEQGLTDTFFEGTPGGKEVHNIPELVRQLSADGANPVEAKDTLLRIFKEVMHRKAANDEDFTLENLIVETFSHEELPIDDSHIFSSAIAELTNYFTKRGIKINFDGNFMVLSPGSGMMQVTDVTGGYLPVKRGSQVVFKEITKRTPLTSEEYRRWKEFNQYVKVSGDTSHRPEEDPNDVLQVASFTNEGAPRDLKGQQVILTNANGSTVELSILRDGDQHLIPEAEALSDIKGFIDSYKERLFSPEYKIADSSAKIDLSNKYYKEFKKELSDFINGKGAKTEEAKAASARALEFFSRFVEKVEKNVIIPKNVDYFEFFYQNLSSSRVDREAKMERQAETGDAVGLAQSLEYEYLDRLNVIGNIFTFELQAFMIEANEGVIPSSLKGEHYVGPPIDEAAKLSISRGEVFAPIGMKKAFLLRENDDFNDISEDFFVERLLEESVRENNGADAALISNKGRVIYFHTGKASPGTRESSRIIDKNGRRWFADESGLELFAIPKNMTVTEIDGDLHIFLNDKHTIQDNAIAKTLTGAFRGEGERFSEYTYFDNTPEGKAWDLEEKVAAAKIKAAMMWNSFQEYIKVIGTRIPGQHFQSFQGLKIVGFVEGNKIYVPNEVTLLSGSDFDIDKQNIIYYSINKEGLLEGWHPAFRWDTPEMLALSLQLPLPGKKQADYFQSELDALDTPLEPIMELNPESDITSLETIVYIYDQLKQGLKLHPIDHAELIENLVEYEGGAQLIKGEGGLMKGRVKALSMDGIKNFVISRANNIIESPLNFLLLYKSVSMATPKMFGDNSSKGAASRQRVRENFVSIAEAKYDNMVGKKVIGIMAAGGLKSLSALTVTYNNSLRELSRLVYRKRVLETSLASLDPIKDNDRANLLRGDIYKTNDEITYISKGLGGRITIANIKYDNLDPDVLKYVKDDTNTSPINELNIVPLTDDIEAPLLEQHNLRKLQLLAMQSEFSPDAAELLSELLSAATDNAKELILAKINATPDLAGIYANMIISNVPFERIVEIMTSPVMEMIIRNVGKNLFNSNTKRNSLKNLISLVEALGDPKKKQHVASNKERLLSQYNLAYDVNISGDDVRPYVYDVGTPEVTHSLSALKDTQVLFDEADALRLLSKYLGINQGVKSNSWELYSFRTSIQDYVNEKLEGNGFDFKRFLDSLEANDNYHKDMIMRLSDKLAATSRFNILYVLASTPNFAKQLVAYNAANTLINLSSYKVNTVYHLVDKLRQVGFISQHNNITKTQYKEFEKHIEDTVIENFIVEESNITYEVGSTEEKRMKPLFYDGDKPMKITTWQERNEFIQWVTDKFLPKIQEQYKNNEFIQQLIVDDKADTLMNTKVRFMHLMMDTTNARKSDQQKAYEDSYLYNLGLLYNHGDTDLQFGSNGPEDVSKQNNIFNVLFWYNLVVNKNNITKNSYAKLLGDLMLRSPGANPYKRLLELKGRLGKIEDVRLTGEQNLVTSNGVQFDLFSLLSQYEVAETKLDFSQATEADWEAQSLLDEVNDDVDVDDDVEVDTTDPGDTEVDVDPESGFDDDFNDEGEPEDGARKNIPIWKVVRTRKVGVAGTITKIYPGDPKKVEAIFDNEGSQALPSMALIGDSRNRTRFMNVTGRLSQDAGLSVNETDAVNYQRFMLLTPHQLLSALDGDIEIMILRDGQEAVTFDPNETYDCL